MAHPASRGVVDGSGASTQDGVRFVSGFPATGLTASIMRAAPARVFGAGQTLLRPIVANRRPFTFA